MSERDEDDPLLDGPSLGADGRLEGRLKAMDAAPPAAPSTEAPLELAPRPPTAVEARVERYREDLRERSRRPWAARLVAGLIALAVVGFVALLRFKPDLRGALPDGVREATLLDQLTRAPGAPPILISSEPSGARIVIGGAVVGQTPWAGENRWVGPTQVVLQLKGYRTWEGQLNGGTEQTLDVALQR